MEKFNLEEYANEAKEILGSKYDYVSTKRNEKNNKIMVGIVCHEKDKYGREHGLFWKNPSKHKRGQGCPICGGNRHMTNEYFIETSKLCHKSRFDNLSYEKTKFVNYKTNVIVTCHTKNDNGEEHGDFLIKPSHLLEGQGCPICRYLKSSNSKKKNFTETIRELRKIYPEYDYSNSEIKYVDRSHEMIVICHNKDENENEHGEFKMIPNNTLNPLLHSGCPKCGREKCDKARKLTFAEFTEKANKRHNNKYIYHEEEFNNRKKNSKLKITCPIHGDFYQTMNNHLYGQGCPICRSSRLEKEMVSFLTEKSIEYESQKTFDWLENKKLDFYLPKYNVAIECQGSQHFIEDHFYEPLEVTQARDERKRKLCEENGVKLLYYSNLGIEYPYEVYEDKEKLLKEIILNS